MVIKDYTIQTIAWLVKMTLINYLLQPEAIFMVRPIIMLNSIINEVYEDWTITHNK